MHSGGVCLAASCRMAGHQQRLMPEPRVTPLEPWHDHLATVHLTSIRIFLGVVVVSARVHRALLMLISGIVTRVEALKPGVNRVPSFRVKPTVGRGVRRKEAVFNGGAMMSSSHVHHQGGEAAGMDLSTCSHARPKLLPKRAGIFGQGVETSTRRPDSRA